MMNRVFTKREKALLAVLAVIVVAAVYYFFVQKPYAEVVPTANEVVEAYTAQGDILQAKYNKMVAMQKEIDELKQSGQAVEIPEYDNASTVINFLNGILSTMNNYTASFGEPSKGSDGIARRSVSVSFTAPTYEKATQAIANIQNCPFLCRINDVSISPHYSGGTKYYTVLGASTLSISISMVFYEAL